MSSKKLKSNGWTQNLILFRRSLIIQTREFFQNSTLHGVRYIAEKNRPIGEKFMWFCFTSIGAVTALVIIMSLWEKFQTNPTITGLDTDFHNQNVIFPTTVVCPEAPFDHNKANEIAFRKLATNDNDTAERIKTILEILPSLNFENIQDADILGNPKDIPVTFLNGETLRYWAFQSAISCNETLITCKYRDENIDCCSYFEPIYTEHGFCYAFNSRFKSLYDADEKTGTPIDLYETDKKWALFFMPNTSVKIFIFSHEEYFGDDFTSSIDWSEGYTVEMRITLMNTYTTDEARQLTIGQRKCIFSDEVKLQYFPDDYTYSSCMKECRMKISHKLCKCNPPFYKPIPNIQMCSMADLPCLQKFKDNITNIRDCQHCELSCSKDDFQIKKLSKSEDKTDDTGVTVEFLTWPVLRYKREVLFGWVDLLVSFGGIASLFLGFSLLSGVEIIYYFTLRACCMLYKNKQELYEIEEEIKRKPPPRIDLSLKPNFRRKKLNDVQENDKENLINSKTNLDSSKTNRKRKTVKEYVDYAKTLYRTPKTIPQLKDETWQYGQYLP